MSEKPRLPEPKRRWSADDAIILAFIVFFLLIVVDFLLWNCKSLSHIDAKMYFCGAVVALVVFEIKFRVVEWMGRGGARLSRGGARLMRSTVVTLVKRRWHQFSLRSLMIFVSVACLVTSGVASWWTWYQRPRVEYHRAVAPILELGGEVEPKWCPELDSGGVAPIWRIDFYGKSLNDTDLQRLEEHLKGLPGLMVLDLGRTQVSDSGLKHLKGLPRLTVLHLGGTQVTDAGLEHLKGLPSLTLLHLGDTQVSDAGLEHLKALTKLQKLNLDRTQITDAGLEHLRKLTKLRALGLHGTQVSDAGLEHLKELTKLGELGVGRTQITVDGRKRFERALPNCRTRYWSPLW